jgi:hypothetical protein
MKYYIACLPFGGLEIMCHHVIATQLFMFLLLNHVIYFTSYLPPFKKSESQQEQLVFNPTCSDQWQNISLNIPQIVKHYFTQTFMNSTFCGSYSARLTHRLNLWIEKQCFGSKFYFHLQVTSFRPPG